MPSNRVLAGTIFVVILLAFTAQTELVEYIQTNGYQQPYFLLYTVHSGYILILPVHYFYLKLSNIDGHAILQKTRAAFQDQLEAQQDPLATRQNSLERSLSNHFGFPALPFIRMSCALALSIAAPALCWYVSIAFTSATDLTAIYNSNAFWAYLFAIWITKTDKLEMKKAFAVALAILGVIVISYGGAEASRSQADEKGLGSKLIGDLLALAGSITFAAYELFYERCASLPSASLQPSEEDDVDEEYKKHSKRRSRHFLLNQSERHSYAGVDGEDDISDNEEATPRASSPQAQNARKSSDLEEGSDASDDLTAVDRFDSPPVYIDETTGKLDHQVFLLHSNIITGGIGFATLVLLAIPLPLLHVLGWETFRLPPTIGIFTAICCNIVVGVVFNAGFMQLISMAGPVMASVGALCTLVCVAIADVLLGGRPMELSSAIGSALITVGFAMLAWNVVKPASHHNQHP